MPSTTEDIKDRLRWAFERSGMTQRELAEHIGISQQSISKWFSKGYLPRLDHLLDAAKPLNVTALWLLLGDEA